MTGEGIGAVPRGTRELLKVLTVIRVVPKDKNSYLFSTYRMPSTALSTLYQIFNFIPATTLGHR